MKAETTTATTQCANLGVREKGLYTKKGSAMIIIIISPRSSKFQ
jgi:hypothetical protein